ncbi:MAG: hypothetical protein IPP94_15745 [Ignavibacteria bacterium]|nr:hypothetical protein [Ignavibacteria bacterium]
MIALSRIDFFHAATAAPESGGDQFVVVASANAFPWHLLDDHAHDNAYRARFRDGARVVLRIEGEALAFRCWLASGTLEIDELATRWSLPTGDLCVYDVVTSAAFRGRGLYPEALGWIRRHTPSPAPVRRVWVYCSAQNASSRRGIEKAEFTHTAQCSALLFRGRAVWRHGRLPGERA